MASKKVKCPYCGEIVHAPAGPASTPSVEPIWKALLAPVTLALILWITLGLKLHNLDHTALTRWDEAFHAVVARNVVKHPLKPTLIDVPYLPYDQTKWGENHVWLHKPILPFWQTALFIALFGVNTLALRLPAALLSTGAAWLTYLIGKSLFDRGTGLIAATLQAVNPFLMSLIHGYQFADNIDIALLFWVEVGMYFLVRALRTGAWLDVLLVGVAQGFAFLSKSYLAGIILGVALTAWLLPYCRLGMRDDCKIGLTRLLVLLGTTLLTVAPWQIFCMTNYPDEFSHEHEQVWNHLVSNVEDWEAPWHRVLFEYSMAIHGDFYTPILVALIALVGKAFAQRHTGLWLAYAWSLGVMIPHLVAVTKTPSATVIALPAFLLLLGHLVAEAWRGGRWPLTVLTAVLFMCIVLPVVRQNPDPGFTSLPAVRTFLGRILTLLSHVGGALALTAVVTIVWTLIGRRWPAGDAVWVRWVRSIPLLFCVGVLIWLGTRSVVAGWRVTSRDVNDPFSVEVGRYVRDNLEENAVLLCDERKPGEHLTTMFYADRTCYPLARKDTDDVMARQIRHAGGIPYVVSHRKLPFRAVHVSEKRGPTIYLWE